MEDEPGLDSSSDEELLTFSELVDKLCPQYMAMGVSYNEFWYGDYTQLEYYRKAFELNQEHENYKAWLQGLYIYEALCDVAPVLNAFAKSGTKPRPYSVEPYGSSKKVQIEQAKSEEELERIKITNASAKFASIMTEWNRKFEEEGGEMKVDD